ncbi:MAG: class I SAM-dependent methyltransferase, partial [Sphingopyxis sp.]|nr:class I SAM-dependent methyltransferase [Sphingopyxis sp.]
APARGERVLDVACGTGLITLAAAGHVGAEGQVTGVDISERMVEAASRRAEALDLGNARFLRMDGECLSCADDSFDLLYCALGLMYMPEWDYALWEMYRVLRPG